MPDQDTRVKQAAAKLASLWISKVEADDSLILNLAEQILRAADYEPPKWPTDASADALGYITEAATRRYFMDAQFHHEVEMVAQTLEHERGVRLDQPDRELFENLAAEWETQTMLESVVTRKAMNPSYQRIIGLGKPAVPLILARLAERPAQWFWALTAITGEDPAEGQTTVDGAAEAWLNWDRSQGLVSG